MSKRKINLDEFIDDLPLAISQYRNKIKSTMIVFGIELLELAAEKIKSDALEDFGTEVPDCWSTDSIINTINQVE